MRLLVLGILLLSTTLAGCSADTFTEQPFQPSCPQWSQISSSARSIATPAFNQTADRPETKPVMTETWGKAYLEDHGRPLDLVEIHIDALSVVDAKVKLQVYGNHTGRLLPMRDLATGDVVYERVFTPDLYKDRTISVQLAPADQRAAPQAVDLTWSFTPDLDQDPDTESRVDWAYNVTYWFRSWEGPCLT